MAGLKIIVTGASGMVGEGVLLETLSRSEVAEVLVIGRRTCGVAHPKLKEILHADFYDFSSIEPSLQGWDACFFCLGVSSVGMKEPAYYKLTYTLTLHVAGTLARTSPNMVFCYVSGAGTDSTEKGRSMWGRVKGKTENDLAKLPFRGEYNFRPGILKATRGQRNTLSAYKYLGWLITVIKWFSPKSVCTLQELGRAMIQVTLQGYSKNHIEINDIHLLGEARP